MSEKTTCGAKLHAEHVDTRQQLAKLQEIAATDETVDSHLEAWQLGYLASCEAMALRLSVKLAAEKREAQQIAIMAAEGAGR